MFNYLFKKKGFINIAAIAYDKTVVEIKKNIYGGQNIKYKALPGQFTLAISKLNRIHLDEVTYFSIHKNIPTYLITLENGKKIKVSAKNSLIVFDHVAASFWHRVDLNRYDPINKYVPAYNKKTNKYILLKIIDYKYLGFKDLYDISLKNYNTFLTSSGAFVYDTLSLHTPVTDEGIREALEMLPSKNLLSEERTGIKTVPDHAAASGLYMLSKTPKGRKLINNILPVEFHIKSPINKSDLKKMLYDMAKTNKYDMNRILSDLRKLGDKYSYEQGLTLGIYDIRPIDKLKNEILNEYKKGIPLKNIAKNIENKFSIYLDEENPLKIMINAKSRGNKSQYRDILVSPITVKSAENRETPIIHSYPEGLSTEEYFDAAKGARIGVMGRSQKTALPGALGKEILSTTNTLVLSGLKNEYLKTLDIPLSANIDDLLDRILAEDIVDNKGNIIQEKDTPINSRTIQIAKKYGYNKLKVYTALGSSNPDGSLPIYSYGLRKDGSLPPDGYNAGAISTLGVVEPLYSSSMESFHTGGSVTESEKGYPRLKQIFEFTAAHDKSKKLPREATLSKIDGIVTKIKKDSIGGHDVYVNNEKYYVSPMNKVIVKEGQKVKKGDPLSDGPIQPKDLAELKSLRDAQLYLVDEIMKNVPALRRRAAEVMVEAITRHAKIIDPGDTDYLPGDIDLINAIEEKNKNVKNKAKYEFLFKGVNTLPQLTQSWLSQLGFRNLKRTFENAITEMKESDIHGYEPVPAMAYSKEFGKGEKGKY